MRDETWIRSPAKWAGAAVLFSMAGLLILAALDPLPQDAGTNPPPPWIAPWAAVVVALFGIAILLPRRPAIVAFSVAFVMAVLFTISIPFSPGPLSSTIEILTPIGYFSKRLSDRPSRVIAAVLAAFAAGLVATVISAALQDEFGKKRWLMAIQGVGLLIVMPFVFALIALMLVLLSPVMLWRAIVSMRQKILAGRSTTS